MTDEQQIKNRFEAALTELNDLARAAREAGYEIEIEQQDICVPSLPDGQIDRPKITHFRGAALKVVAVANP